MHFASPHGAWKEHLSQNYIFIPAAAAGPASGSEEPLVRREGPLARREQRSILSNGVNRNFYLF
ncbi:MAG: hypothetical protein COZ69_06770 [Deltaproteobacteria bacterium CG_4_8_14_3_um_filter_45_9]|nr:MAG: hypothetical protein COS40_11685 [Deltaproteobacteria bacterium CG03_land_8_20_14_0_80_45_14]PIX24190.1 MAG: hypothetical protein COZ69_06770 [Deltaproteobacteria bacterium CG_4_8_14_3_um_filter_45_9]